MPPSAVDETVNLLHPPPPLLGVSIVIKRERQQSDSSSGADATRIARFFQERS